MSCCRQFIPKIKAQCYSQKLWKLSWAMGRQCWNFGAWEGAGALAIFSIPWSWRWDCPGLAGQMHGFWETLESSSSTHLRWSSREPGLSCFSRGLSQVGHDYVYFQGHVLPRALWICLIYRFHHRHCSVYNLTHHLGEERHRSATTLFS